ncbi:MAG: PspC domain-containing protein [Candidatus Liptonbacteria bacterium]
MEGGKKELYRSRKNRIIAGVCGGLSEYFEVDATLVRVIFIALLIIHGIGGLFYLIFWILTPREPDGEVRERSENTKDFLDDIERELEILRDKIKQKKVKVGGIEGIDGNS